MERLKFYCNLEDLNEEEKRTNRISYRRLIERIGDVWLFNKAPELSDYRLEKLNEIGCKDVIIAWSEKLENYVLFVDHCGTSWDYVMTDFEPTNDYNKADF